MKITGETSMNGQYVRAQAGTGPSRGGTVPGLAGGFGALAVLAAILLAGASARGQSNAPPIILTCPSNITVAATSAAGALPAKPDIEVSGGKGGMAGESSTVAVYDSAGNILGGGPFGTWGFLTFPVGTSTVVEYVQDHSQPPQSATCSFTVTVTPYVPPPIMVTCPSNITVAATSAAGALPAKPDIEVSGGKGGMAGESSTVAVYDSAGNILGGGPFGTWGFLTFPVGTSTVVEYVQNHSQPPQSATCSFTVTVTPYVPPPIMVTCPSNITVAATSAAGALPAKPDIEVSGGKGGMAGESSTVAVYDSAGNILGGGPFGTWGFLTFPVGTSTVVEYVQDHSQPPQSATCSFTVTVTPYVPPPIMVTCPSNITVAATSAAGALPAKPDIEVSGGKGGMAGESSTVAVYDSAGNILGGGPFGTWGFLTFPVGTSTVVEYVQDHSQPPQSATCSFTVTVTPWVVPPIMVTCPSNITVAATSAAGALPAKPDIEVSGGEGGMAGESSTVAVYDSAGNILDGGPFGTWGFLTFPVGTSTVVEYVQDHSQPPQTATCSFTVTVTPWEVPPVVVCKPSITVSNDAGLCSATVTAAQVDNGSYAPRGGPVMFTLTPPPPYPLGSNTVTFTATGTNGLSASTNVLIVVLDTTPPNVVCPAPVTVAFQDENGAVVQYVVTASDLCSAVSLAVTPVSGSVFPIGLTPVRAQAWTRRATATSASST